MLTGFWHGAAWTFILWGLYYFILLILERTLLKNIINKIPKFIMYIITIILVMIGWTLFRANSLSDFWLIITNIFSTNGTISIKDFLNQNLDIIPSLPYFIFAIIFSTNVYQIINNKFEKNMVYIVIKKIVLIILLLLCIMFLVSSKYNPFIYFRF